MLQKTICNVIELVNTYAEKHLEDVTKNTLRSANSEQKQSAPLKDTVRKRQNVNLASKQCSHLRDILDSQKPVN